MSALWCRREAAPPPQPLDTPGLPWVDTSPAPVTVLATRVLDAYDMLFSAFSPTEWELVNAALGTAGQTAAGFVSRTMHEVAESAVRTMRHPDMPGMEACPRG